MMRYKIVVTTVKKDVADKVHKAIRDSRIYNSQEIVMLNKVREVCDECATKR